MLDRLLLFLLLCSTLRAQDLTGVIDLHVHCGPDSMPRAIDCVQATRLAKQCGLRAVVLKNHFEPTASLAWVAASLNPGIQVFGGIALNRAVGGINPAAVERMTQVTGRLGRVVWMPTFDSENQAQRSGGTQKFVSLSRNGTLLPEVIEVLRLIGRHDLVLATGHSSATENLLLVREAKRLGVKRVLITHAMMAPIQMSTEEMQRAAEEGAFIEFVCNGVVGPHPAVRVSDVASAIRAVGVQHAVLSSDLGQPENPLHVEGLKMLFAHLRAVGFQPAEIERMAKQNPATLLGLETSPVTTRFEP